MEDPDNSLCFLNHLDPIDFIFINEDEKIELYTDHIKRFKPASHIKKPIFILLKNGQRNHELFETESLFDFILTKPVLPSILLDALTGMIDKPVVKYDSFNPDNFRCLESVKILLVDDNQINQDVVKELLGILHVNIDLCDNGADAIKLIGQKSFDIVLMDVQMPGMDGYETTRRIRHHLNLPALPIIAMTANALDGDREKCLQVGMNDYLSKPIIPQLLFETLVKWSPYKTTEAGIENTAIINNNHDILLPELRRLSEISDLDIQSALFRLLNNESFYCKLIEKFTTSRAGVAEEIVQSVNNNDFEEATRIMHSFKSMAGTIGAVKLQTLAAELESGLNQSMLDKNILNDLVDELHSLIAKIQTALATDN
jgi:CheY-like chemotaxis protein